MEFLWFTVQRLTFLIHLIDSRPFMDAHIDRLAAYKDVDVLCFDHDNSKDMDALMATPLWQAMPFVRAGRFQRVPAVWFYGATLSAMHFVRILDNAIGGKA